MFSLILFITFVGFFFMGLKDMKRASIIDGLKELISSIAVVLVINWLFFQLSVVPTGSMIPTVLKGDVVLVSKLHYGATTPATPLHIPFTRERIPWLNIRSYLSWLQLPTYRLPGFSKPKCGDCVVIQTPRANALPDVPPDVQVPYLKRIVGGPSHEVSIIDGRAYVNGKLSQHLGKCQYKYLIKTKERLTSRFFKRYNIEDYQRMIQGGVMIYTTEDIAERLRSIHAIDAVERVIQPKGKATKSLAFVSSLGGNEDQLDPFIVPYKGMEVVLDKSNILLYIDAIKECEGNRKVKVDLRDGVVWIGGERVEKYRFREDCYFMLGVNWNNSCDSRGFGLVPESNIRGKAIMVLLSGKNPDWHIVQNLLAGNIRWKRLGTMLR